MPSRLVWRIQECVTRRFGVAVVIGPLSIEIPVIAYWIWL